MYVPAVPYVYTIMHVLTWKLTRLDHYYQRMSGTHIALSDAETY